MEDNWKRGSDTMLCKGCLYFVIKQVSGDKPVGIKSIGRCRRNAPTIKGWPAVFTDDWCGDHKIDENKI